MADDAFAAEKPFEIKIVGRTAATYTVTPGANENPPTFSSVIVDLIVESAQPVGLLGGYDGNDDGAFDQPENGDVADPGVVKKTAIDKNGFVVTDAVITVADRRIGEYPMRTAKKRQLRIIITQVPDLDDATKGRIVKVVIEIAAAGIKTTDPTVLATDGTDTKLNESKLVQHTITLSEGVEYFKSPDSGINPAVASG